MSNSDLKIEHQKEIIENFKSDPEVFSEVYEFYYEPIYRYLLKRTTCAEDAYDMVSETFIKAFKNFHKFKWQGISIKTWLYRIAINELKNHHKKPKTDALPEDYEDNPHLVADVKSELEALNQAMFEDEKLTNLNKGIKSLNKNYQDIISFYYFTGLSQSEIAAIVNRSESAVKSMMHRAVENLRELMLTKHE